MTASVLKQDQCTQKVQKNADFNGEPVRLVSRGTSVRICFGFPVTSKVVVCGHCLLTLSLTIMKH